MKNIHLLPTDKSSRLSIKDGVLILHRLQWRKGTQNIYITSDEEIKMGDWHLVWLRDKWEVLNYMPSIGYRKECLGKEVCKIILTTDQDLIKDGVQAIPDEFLEWFVKNPSCEEVEVEIESKFDRVDGHYHDVWEIIIPKEETLEEAKKYAELSYYGDEVDAFVRGAKWQQEQNKKMYSEEDMLNFAWFLKENLGQYSCDRTAHFEGKYLEQFKKK